MEPLPSSLTRRRKRVWAEAGCASLAQYVGGAISNADSFGQVRSAIRSSTSADVGGCAPRREQTMEAAAAPRSKEASSPRLELHPAIEEAGHEGVAGTDRVDHLGRESPGLA